MRKVDWFFYTKLLWWENRVACALSVNREPEGFERDHPYNMGSADAAIRREFDKRMELLSQAVASQEVFSALPPGVSYYKHVRPTEFVKWADAQGLLLPAELMQLIPSNRAADAEAVPANVAPKLPAATRRRDILQAAIDEAITRAGGIHDAAAIYDHLREMALSGHSPFTTADESGLVYTDPHNKTRSLTFKQLRDRLRLRRTRSDA